MTLMMRVYNTLSRRLEDFVPLQAGTVQMYHCGPTVYGRCTIGNFRAFLFADLLRRHLEVSGLRVKQIMNITDVGHLQHDADEGEDKLEAQARAEKKDPWEIARHYTELFLQDQNKLHSLSPDAYPKATDHIPEMIQLIQSLLAQGHAYVVNGNVYYSVASFPSYGQLSGNPVTQLEAGARVEVHPDKKHPFDFALWKQDARHIMQWDSPWGRGFPGWHIECSAMSMKYLGNTFDIHTGGEDNIFPHHECEIAQSEGATHQPLARYWMHTRFLLVDGEKMSKSKGNVYTLSDLEARGSSLRAVRYALLSAHYRQPLNFTWEALHAATKAVDRIDECHRIWSQPTRSKTSSELADSTNQALQKTKAALDQDLNMPEALASFFSWINDVNRLQAHSSELPSLESAWNQFDRWFGFVHSWETVQALPASVQTLITARDQARTSKNFKRSDELRDELSQLGYDVKDTPQGTQVKKRS